MKCNHVWNGCKCLRCGEERHNWIKVDISDYQSTGTCLECTICGEVDVDSICAGPLII
jgi:hypothetical protein